MCRPASRDEEEVLEQQEQEDGEEAEVEARDAGSEPDVAHEVGTQADGLLASKRRRRPRAGAAHPPLPYRGHPPIPPSPLRK